MIYQGKDIKVSFGGKVIKGIKMVSIPIHEYDCTLKIQQPMKTKGKQPRTRRGLILLFSGRFRVSYKLYFAAFR